jgi:hypothetical protein
MFAVIDKAISKDSLRQNAYAFCVSADLAAQAFASHNTESEKYGK